LHQSLQLLPQLLGIEVGGIQPVGAAFPHRGQSQPLLINGLQQTGSFPVGMGTAWALRRLSNTGERASKNRKGIPCDCTQAARVGT
jgi:hypothetical protein